jgi:putative endonuclease
MKFFYTYVLVSAKDGKQYVGYTSDLKKRFEEHNAGKNFSTKYRRPFTLVYYEACLNEKDAKQREKYFKNTVGRRYLSRRLGYFRASHKIFPVKVVLRGTPHKES